MRLNGHIQGGTLGEHISVEVAERCKNWSGMTIGSTGGGSVSCELAFLSSPTCCCCCCCCHPICSLLLHWGFMAKQAARYFVGAHLSDMGICWSPRKRLLKETGGGFISHWHADNKLEPA